MDRLIEFDFTRPLAFLALSLYVVRQGNVIAALEGKLAKQDRIIDALTEPREDD